MKVPVRLIIGFFVAILVSVLFKKQIHKFPWVFYAVAILLDICFLISRSPDLVIPVWLMQYVLVIFQSNTCAMGFFTIVMFTGAFSDESVLRKMFMPIRAELSIIASLLSIAHVVNYGSSYLTQLLSASVNVPPIRLAATLISFILVLLLIPLFITSFKAVRKRMSANSWKRIQWLAYPFYILVFVHILSFLLIPVFAGKLEPTLRIDLYMILLAAYIFLRIRRFRLRKLVPATT